MFFLPSVPVEIIYSFFSVLSFTLYTNYNAPDAPRRRLDVVVTTTGCVWQRSDGYHTISRQTVSRRPKSGENLL